jgi:hypothetical protein
VDRVQKTTGWGAPAEGGLFKDLHLFKVTAAKAATGVPVTPVEAQEPAETVPPTRHPALEPLHEVKEVT